MRKTRLILTTFVVLVAFSMSIMSCGDDKRICTKDVEGKDECYTYLQYGLFDQDKRNPDIEYKVIPGNVVWGLIDIVPVGVIIFGWYLYEPVGAKVESGYRDKTPKRPGAIDESRQR